MRRFHALINPISGGGRSEALWRPIEELLRANGSVVTSQRTHDRAHAIEAAEAAAARGEVVIAAGGDGLVRDIAQAVVPASGTMAIVPAGRGNDLAAVLGITAEPAAAARLLLQGPVRSLDMLEVNGVLAPGNVYIGIDSLATRIINRSRRLPGLLAYRMAPVRAILSWRAANYTLTIDGHRSQVKAHTVVVANSGAYGHGLNIVPTAKVDDGLLHVMVVGDGPRRAIVKFMSLAKRGAHTSRPEVSVRTATELTIAVDRPVPVCADGDEVTVLPATIRVRPRAISMIAPES